MQEKNHGLYRAFTAKGIFPLIFTGLILVFVGIFLIVQSAIGELLPHDIQSLQMTTAQLSVFNNGKIVKFMFHDRVAFGGSLISVGLLYIWLAAFPLKEKHAWAWWLFLISGLVGFGSFFTYIGHGYLDAWHQAGTLVLLPIFISGLYYSFIELEGAKNIRCLLIRNNQINCTSMSGMGNLCFLFTAFGLFMGGITIMVIGMTSVFVPQDLGYMRINICGMQQINKNLIPIIAHDRASFGGGLSTIGVMLFFSVWCPKPNRALWEILALAVSIGFYSAIGIHFLIGYLDFWHIAPAYFGLFIFCIGLYLSYNGMMKKEIIIASI